MMLQLSRVGFAYADSVPLFESVNLELPDGWTALVGPNGAGKTTLLRLISGELQPASGDVRVEGLVILCEQRVDVIDADVRHFAADDGRRARRLRAKLDLDPALLDRWPTASPGERKRWQIGAALHSEPDVLLLDEPTNHLDATARALLVRALEQFRGVGVVVSHDRELLARLCTATARVARGRVDHLALDFEASSAQWRRDAELEHERASDARAEVAKRRRQAAAEQRQLVERQAAGRTRKRMKGPRDHDARSTARKGRVAAGAARMSRAAGASRARLERAEEAAASLTIERPKGRSLFVGWSPPRRQRLVDLVETTIHAGDLPVLRDVSLTVDANSRVAVTGPNGSGKTTLLAALRRAARVPEERLLVLPQELSAEQGRCAVDEARAMPREERGRLLQLVAALGTDPDRLLPSDAPSPGEARKLVLAMGLARHAWLLLLDEPTNHLDLPTIERLESALADYPGAVVAVSHDTTFLERIADVRWAVENERVTASTLSDAPPSTSCR
jgi:ATPase subunit of ABC transporter with duplicated ATPase domains